MLTQINTPQTKPNSVKSANIQSSQSNDFSEKAQKIASHDREESPQSDHWSDFLDRLTETRAVQNYHQSVVDDWEDMQVELEEEPTTQKTETTSSFDINSLPNLAKTEIGSRKLQEWVPSASYTEKKLAWNAVAHNDFICDTYANIFIQKLMETAPSELMESILAFLEKRLTILSHDSSGCWVIQKAIELNETIANQWLDTLSENNLADLIVCKHGHYVVQKLIEKASLDKLGPIEDAFRDRYAGYSIHEYGYHVVLVLVDHASDDFRMSLMESVMKYFLCLAKHKFGNFVIWHLMVSEAVSAEKKREIALLVLKHFNRLCFDAFGSFVVEKCLESQCLDARLFMRELLRLANADLVRVMGNAYGNYVVQKIIEMATVGDVDGMKGVLQRRGIRPLVSRGRGKHVIRAIKRKLVEQA